jgi:polyhydroxybutyrate depolymerase
MLNQRRAGIATPRLNGLRSAAWFLLPLAIALLATVAGPGLPAARAGQGADEATSALAPGDYEFSVRHGVRKRFYLVHVPRGAAPGRPRPVVLAFHGGGGNAKGMRRYYGLDRVADREGFFVVFPDGSGRLSRSLLTWNAGSCCGYAKDQGIDDVGFVAALLTDLARRTPIDPTRIYATGHSNGAMMAYRLAVEMPDRIAAIAPVAGGMVAANPNPHRPVPVLHIHSEDDPRALYEGGWGPPFPLTQVRVLHPSIPETIRWWIQHDGCPSEPHMDEVLRGAPDSADASHTAQRVVYGPCKEGSEVVLLRLTGAGHGWPGGTPFLSEQLVGPATSLVSASEEAWSFFRRFSRANARLLP